MKTVIMSVWASCWRSVPIPAHHRSSLFDTVVCTSAFSSLFSCSRPLCYDTGMPIFSIPLPQDCKLNNHFHRAVLEQHPQTTVSQVFPAFTYDSRTDTLVNETSHTRQAFSGLLVGVAWGVAVAIFVEPLGIGVVSRSVGQSQERCSRP